MFQAQGIDRLDSLNNNFLSFFSKKTTQYDFHIAFMLPFCSDYNQDILNVNIDSVITNDEFLTHLQFYKKTRISIDFLLGFYTSLNKFNDINIKISVFDIKDGNDSENIIKKIVHDKDLKDVDLIIGPLFTDNLLFLSKYISNSIPLVSPFSKKKHITEHSSNIIQIQSLIEHQLPELSEFIFNNHFDDNILLIRRDTIFETSVQLDSETELNNNFIDTIIPKDLNYTSLLLKDIDTTALSFREIKVNTNVIDSIHHELDTLGMNNIIIIPSEDNVFVTDLLSKLHACRDTNMIVYGLSSLFNFNHLPITDLMDMKLTFPYHKFDHDSIIDNFLIDFYNIHNYVPEYKYASVGYEIGLYFLGLLCNHQSILPHLDELDPNRVLETIYDFEKNKNGGYLNKGFMILRYDDFGYKKIN